MKLVALGLAIAVVVGYLLGGRLSQLSELKVRHGWVAFVGLLLQLVNPPGRWPLVLLLLSFLLLTAFTLANIKTAGFAVVLVGVAMNFTVIALNGGMPVGREALIASGQSATLAPLIEQQGRKHHLAGPDDRLRFLGDVIAIPAPVSQVISVGDVLTYGGVVLVVVAAMRRRIRPLEMSSAPEAGRVHV